jgi:predicted HTH domain antitoxin
MVRPRLFKREEMASVNLYLSVEQKDAVGKMARTEGISPSAFLRELIEKEIKSRATGSEEASPD